MTTSHLCNGTWKPGPVASCSKHKRLSKKQTSVFRSGEGTDPASSGDGGSEGSGGDSS